MLGLLRKIKEKTISQKDIEDFCISFNNSRLVDYYYLDTLHEKGWHLDKTLECHISAMNEQEVGTCLTAIVQSDDLECFLSNGIFVKLLERLESMGSLAPSKFLAPKYVVVSSSHFGTGNHGWRLSEVDRYCFAESYPKAKKLKEKWQKIGIDNLVYMIKYENWIDKGGPPCDDTSAEKNSSCTDVDVPF